MAAPDVKQGVFTLNVSTGNQSVTGVGFQPKVVLFKVINKGGEGNSPHIEGSFGWAISSSSQRSMVWSSEDNVGTSVCRRGWSNSRCFYCLTQGTSTIEFEVSFVSQDSDGFTINVVNGPAFGVKVMFLALGGSEITNVEGGDFDLLTGTGDQAVTGLSDQPDFLLMFGTLGSASPNATNGDIVNTIGFASGADNEASISWASDNGQGTSDCNKLQRTDYIFAMVNDTGSIHTLTKLKSFDSAGFTLTKDTAPPSSQTINYLVITGGAWYVGNFLSRTSTGNFDVTGMGFTPVGVMLASFLNAASTSIQSDLQVVVGMATSSTERGCRGSSAEDGVGTTNTFMYLEDDYVYDNLTVAEAKDGSADFVSFISGGMRLNQDDADTSANQIIYFAMGEVDTGQTITPNSIVSSEAFGSPTIIIEQFITPNGIITSEAFGLPSLIQYINPNGIITSEAFGIPTVFIEQYIDSVSIDSSEAFGLPSLDNQFITVFSVDSSEAFGEPSLILSITPVSIDSSEAFGEPNFIVGTTYVLPESVLSSEAFGLIESIAQVISPSSIETNEEFGEPSFIVGNIFIDINSIISAESFGEPTTHTTHFISSIGIESAESFGEPTIYPGIHNIDTPNSILSEEAFGLPSIIVQGVSIGVIGIASSEIFGSLSLLPQVVSIHPNSIESSEVFGNPGIETGNINISPNSVLSAEIFGIPSLSPGNIFCFPSSISSEELFGIHILSVGNVNITPNSILSSEQWGNPGISVSVEINSILSGEAFGNLNITTGGVNILLNGIPSEEIWSSPIIRNVLVITTPESIPSEESLGNFYVYIRELSPFQEQLEKDLNSVFFVNDTEFVDKTLAVFTYPNGEQLQIKVIFDEEYVGVDVETGAMVQSQDPMIICQSSKFTKRPGHGCKMQIRGVNYDVLTYEPDGTGVSRLTLHHEKTI